VVLVGEESVSGVTAEPPPVNQEHPFMRVYIYSVKIGDKVSPDLVWTYPDPIPECPKIKGHLCFFNEQVDEIRVDGVPVPRPLTPWSKDWKEKAAAVPDSRGPMVRP
jgi:hypothetical protein